MVETEVPSLSNHTGQIGVLEYEHDSYWPLLLFPDGKRQVFHIKYDHLEFVDDELEGEIVYADEDF